MERKTIIWSIAITAIVIIAGYFGAFFWLNTPINAIFGPEPSLHCEQDSDCTYAITYCTPTDGGCYRSSIVNTAYSGPFCPLPKLPGRQYLCKMVEYPPIVCIQSTCVAKTN